MERYVEQFIIEPPYGHDYLVVSGTLSNIVRALPMMPDCVVQPCSYHVSNFQFDRYIKTAQGIQDLLNTHSDLQLEIRYEVLENTYQGQIILLIKPKKNLTQLIEFSQDYDNKINLTITQDGNTPRRLICLGEGELKNRKVINLYADENWNIVKVGPRNTFPVETYEYSSSNSLIVDGVKHFRELIANHQQIEITIEDSSLNLGDIISAKDILTETYIQAEISGIILKKTKNTSTDEETIEYQTKVRSRI